MLDGFFKPKAVAVVGAYRDEGQVGFSITMDLIRGRFPGPNYPVNPKANEILGLTRYPDVKEVPADADLAFLVTQPRACLPTLDALGRLSQLCTYFPEIVELDVNPLIVKHEEGGAVAIDARLALAG